MKMPIKENICYEVVKGVRGSDLQKGEWFYIHHGQLITAYGFLDADETQEWLEKYGGKIEVKPDAEYFVHEHGNSVMRKNFLRISKEMLEQECAWRIYQTAERENRPELLEEWAK
jgi:hypothetical protein